MSDSLYKGSHRKLFKEFLKLVDDSDSQIAALLNSSSWNGVRSILSIGGGKGIIEASLLKNAPLAYIWYLDPSEEQGDAFREHMKSEELSSRVKDITQATFQDFNTDQKFDRIVSIFSWFYIGSEERWLAKLLDSLTPSGHAFVLLPNKESIESSFYKALSPDKRMTLIGDDVVENLKNLNCTVSQEKYTKWLSPEDLFVGEQLSDGSLAFAAFAAERSFDSFAPDEKKHVVELLKTNQESRGVPLSWDLINISLSFQ